MRAAAEGHPEYCREDFDLMGRGVELVDISRVAEDCNTQSGNRGDACNGMRYKTLGLARHKQLIGRKSGVLPQTRHERGQKRTLK
jgi:hypothetical protein